MAAALPGSSAGPAAASGATGQELEGDLAAAEQMSTPNRRAGEQTSLYCVVCLPVYLLWCAVCFAVFVCIRTWTYDMDMVCREAEDATFCKPGPSRFVFYGDLVCCPIWGLV